jgi:hypothetical protein
MNAQTLAIIVAIFSLIGTGVSNLIFKIFGNAIDLQFDKWKLLYADKRQWADEIIKIYTEGSSAGWNQVPRNYEHIVWLSNQIEGFDKKTAQDLRQCAGYWFINSLKQKSATGGIPPTPSNEDMEFCLKLQKDADSLGNTLLKTAHKWKNK